MEKNNETSTETRHAQTKNVSILQSDVKDVAVEFWDYLKRERNSALLDADVKDITKEVLKFLNKDVIGQKIILLHDEKLQTATAVARALKRKRDIIKTDEQKSSVARIKKIYEYLNNPVWQNSTVVGKSRAYLDSHLRKMTPSVLEELSENVEKLQTYFNGTILDDRILVIDETLEQSAPGLGYHEFTVCEKHQQPLTKDKTGDVLCGNIDCSTEQCPFEAGNAQGEEVIFLSGLGKLLTEIGIIREERIS